MRKCPNCKKAVPVGARRCVHCRALVGEASVEADNSSTRMGFGGSRDSYSGESKGNNMTSLGLPGTGGLSRGLEDSSMRCQLGAAFDAAPHQTMIGLGPIESGTSRGEVGRSPKRQSFSQTTIAGMPGIAFDALSLAGEGARTGDSGMVHMRTTPARGMASVSSAGGGNPRPVTPAVAVKPVPAPDSGKPVAGEPEDIFFGLPGVAPKPSSLLDEEFVDLTSKLFGDDFAVDAKEAEEDGWDFDVPSEPVSTSASPEVLAVPASSPEVSPEPVAPVAPTSEVAAPVQSEPSQPQPEVQDSRSSVEPSEESSLPATSVASRDVARGGGHVMDKGMVIGAVVSMAVFFVWIVKTGIEAGIAEQKFCVIAAILCIVLDASCLVFRRHLGGLASAGLFGGGIFCVVGAMALSGSGILNIGLLMVGLLLQVVSAVLCVFRK